MYNLEQFNFLQLITSTKKKRISIGKRVTMYIIIFQQYEKPEKDVYTEIK